MFNVKKTQEVKILDFDIENRPLSYWYGDATTAEITAIAWGWIDEKAIHVFALGETKPEEMLLAFKDFYDRADIVTGHYIKRHDLPIINGALLEYGLPTLEEKRAQDTKLDLIKKHDMSVSQESLAMMYGLPEAKHHMSQPEWREANRLTAEGVKYTKKRVVDDVKQHKALRERLIEANALKPPKVWRP